MDESQFRGTGHQREHALTEERPAEINAIESTHEMTVFIPHLDTRSKALTMQFSIGLDDIGAEPGAVLFIAILGRSTSAYNTIEIFVDGESVLVFVDQLTHGMTDVNFLGEDHKPLQRTVPEGFLPITEREPGEETVGIGQQQTVDGKVAPHSHQTIILTIMGIRESEFIV